MTRTRARYATRETPNASRSQVKHFVIVHRGARFSIDGPEFDSVPELVEHYQRTKHSLAKVSDRDA